MKIIKWINGHLEEAMLCILLVCISCVEMIQVIARNIDAFSSLTWAEEFCRFCWIWSVFLSLPYTIKMASMLRVNVLLDLLSTKAKKWVNIFVDLVTTIVMIVLGIGSVFVVQNIAASGETSPAMLWPMWAVYSVLIIGFLLGTLRGIQKILEHAKDIAGLEKTKKDNMSPKKEESDVLNIATEQEKRGDM